MAYTNVKEDIDLNIYLNDEGLMTAPQVNGLLKRVTDSIGSLQCRGVATEEMNPGTIDQNCFFFARKGNYEHFGNITITEPFGILHWNGLIWNSFEMPLSVDVDGGTF